MLSNLLFCHDLIILILLAIPLTLHQLLRPRLKLGHRIVNQRSLLQFSLLGMEIFTLLPLLRLVIAPRAAPVFLPVFILNYLLNQFYLMPLILTDFLMSSVAFGIHDIAFEICVRIIRLGNVNYLF